MTFPFRFMQIARQVSLKKELVGIILDILDLCYEK